MTPTAHVFRMMVKSRRVAMGKGNRVQTRRVPRQAWLYPAAAERAYAVQIRRWLMPLRRQVTAYLKVHFEAMAKADRSDAPTAPELPPATFRHRTVREFIADLGQPYLSAPVAAPEPLVVRGVPHRDRVPGTKVTMFVQTTNGWVAQQWPAGGLASPQIMMGLGDTAASVLKANSEQMKKQTKSVLGLSFENTAGDWWPDLRDRWADRNYALIKNLASDYIGRINDHVERAVTNGWSLQDLTDDIQGIGDGMSDRRARVIARDQVGKLNGQITQAQQTEIGIDKYIWDTAGDERVRGRPGGKYPDSVPSHWIMQGLVCRWDDASVYSDDGGRTWKPRTSDMPDGHPGDDIQCFSGDTEVRSLVATKKLFRYRHRGKAAVVVTDQGVLTATLNHPILVEGRGWTPVELLEVGDKLITAPEHIFRTILVDDVEEAHPSFEDLFSLARVVGLDERTPGKAADFYGDGPIDKEIEVVSLEGELADYIPGESEKHFMDLVFTRADMGLVELPGSRDLFNMLLALGFAPDSGMSLLGKLLAVFGAQFPHPHHVRGRTVSYLDSILVKAKSDGMPGDSVLLREFEDALASLVRGDDGGVRKLFSIWRCVATASHREARAVETLPQLLIGDIERLGNNAKGSTTFPHGVRLLEKRIVELDIHVFTLETNSGWYTVGKDTIIARNCRCTALPYFDDLVGVIDQGIDGEAAPPPPRRTAGKPKGGLPSDPDKAMAFLAEAVEWVPLLARGFKQAAPELARIGDSYTREFPVMKGAITHIGEQNQVIQVTGRTIPADIKKHAFAWQLATGNGKSVVGINFRGIGRNPADWKEQLAEAVATGWTAQGTGTFKSVIDHELGHVIDALTGARRDQQILNLYYSLTSQQIGDGLSIYARRNIAEFIAEGWAEYRNNPKARDISRKIGDRLTELLRMKEKH
jgi:hypothetical protein